jgi:hypothetical protein
MIDRRTQPTRRPGEPPESWLQVVQGQRTDRPRVAPPGADERDVEAHDGRLVRIGRSTTRTGSRWLTLTLIDATGRELGAVALGVGSAFVLSGALVKAGNALDAEIAATKHRPAAERPNERTERE